MTDTLRSGQASAPAKVVLLGEHGVNRDQPALVAAVDTRARCHAAIMDGPNYTISSSLATAQGQITELTTLAAEIRELRRSSDHAAIRQLSDRDLLAPIKYVLGHLHRDLRFAGIDISVESDIPIGAGFGSGAAVACAVAVATAAASGIDLGGMTVASLGWSGDIVAHGGVASGLDSSACALGGVVRYTLAGGPEPLAVDLPLRLIVADTGRAAKTSAVNARVQAAVAADPRKRTIFEQIGALVADAVDAVRSGDLVRLGALMDENQTLLQLIDVSSPEINSLVVAARSAGALGAKLSGSGGGGIVIALCRPGQEGPVVAAMTAAGGRCRTFDAGAGVAGARPEQASIQLPVEGLVANSS